MTMSNKYLISLLLSVFFVKGYTQNPKIEDLTRLNEFYLSDFQEYMYENNFLFYQANTDEKIKTDTISFINKQNVIIGFVASKKKNTVFMENIKEDYFRELNEDLKHPDFILVETKVKAKNVLEKTYINTTTENIIEVSVISGAEQSNQIENTYKLTVIKPDKRIFRKYLSQVKN